MPGPVSTHLLNTLQGRLQRHRVLVWYDPDRTSEAFADAADLASTRVLRLDGSYFKLRRDAEPVLSELRAGKPGENLLIYVPREPLRPVQNVLLPVEALGSTFRTDLGSLAREALKGNLPAAKVDEWCALPGLTLAKLDELAAGEEDIGVLEAVFGKVGPQEVGFLFLRDEAYAGELKQQKLLEPLRALLDATFGVAVGSEVRTPAKLRDAFAQRALLHEFLDDLAEIPPQLSHLSLPDRPAQVAACRHLAARLRETKPLEEQYRTWAAAAEELYGLRAPTYSAEQLGRCDTFAFEAEYALEHVRELAEAGQWPEARAWVAERSRSFWSATDETLRGRWHAMELAVDLWLTTEAAQQGMPNKGHTAAKWVEWYTGPGADAGWRVDRILRRLDALAGRLLDQSALDSVIQLARASAAEAERRMAERFWDRLQGAPGDLAALPAQADVFKSEVEHRLGDNPGERRVVFVLADALRYEMGRELAELLQPSGRVELGYAAATPPTITKVGMAALVPGAENGLALVPAGEGSGIAAQIGDDVLPTLEARRKRYAAALGARVRDLSLDDCLSLSLKKLEQQVASADLLLLRSQDLDLIGEQDNLHLARTTMSAIIPDLHRGISRLAKLGFGEVVVCADHGFLLREDISEAMKLDKPTGEVLELHRRCAIGRHLGGSGEYAVFRAADLGLGGDLELAFPRGINVFKTVGNLAYHHGGLSLQELVVPVLRYTPAVQRPTAPVAQVSVELKGARKVTNGIFQVELSYPAADLFDQQVTRRFRISAVEARKGGAVLGNAMTATHGWAGVGEEIHLTRGESSTVAMYLPEPPGGSGELILRVDDVEAGETICEKKIRYEFIH